MTVMFASDLDDTLLYRMPVVGPGDVVVDTPARGLPIGMTRAAQVLLNRLNRWGLFVPVTARAQVTYERIDMPGGTPKWAAVAAGGVLLHHGKVDEQWRAKLIERAGDAAPLADMHRLLGTSPGLGEPRVIDSSYVLADIEDPEQFAAVAAQVARTAADGGWGASAQHGKIHLFPKHVSKAAAVAEIAERSGAQWVAAAGDSLMDAPMLERADRALRPAAGELHDVGWTAPHAEVVPAHGMAAGELILQTATLWLTNRQEAMLWSRRADEGTPP